MGFAQRLQQALVHAAKGAVTHTDDVIARLRGLSEEAVGEATSANFRRLFKLDV